MKKYTIPLAALSGVVILASSIAAAPNGGPRNIPPAQLAKINLPPPGSPVPADAPAHLLSPDGILFLAPDGLAEPPGKGKPVLLPFPAAVF